jgi:hypothetical protein
MLTSSAQLDFDLQRTSLVNRQNSREERQNLPRDLPSLEDQPFSLPHNLDRCWVGSSSIVGLLEEGLANRQIAI